MPRVLSKDVQNDLKSLLIKEIPYNIISKRLGLAKSAISRYSNKWFPNRIRHVGGRPTIVADKTKSLVKKKVLNGELLTAADVHKELCKLGYDLTPKSAANVLKSMNFFSAIKKKKPFLSNRHRQNRLNFAKRYQNWTIDDWRRVVFSDETKVNVWGSDGCKYYWSRPGDKLKPHHLDLTVKHGGGNVMMWGCITYSGPGYACQIYDGTMKAIDYQEILNTTFKDSMDYYNFDWSEMYFQQDNDPKHKATSTMKWIDEQGIKILEDWPAQSPDLNPIEHVWHHLKLKLSAYSTKAKGVHELWERIDKEWNSFTEMECRRYIDSMPDRIRAVLEAKGGPTRY